MNQTLDIFFLFALLLKDRFIYLSIYLYYFVSCCKLYFETFYYFGFSKFY